MKPFSDDPIKASTPGLDAMAARQNEPIRASTPGLDAMAAKSDKPLLERLREEDKSKKDAAADKLAEGKAKAQANRDARKLQRGLKRAEITGRVNNFVRDWANQNAAVNKAVNAQGQTVNVAELPGVGMLDVGSGDLVKGPLFEAPTSKMEVPPEGGGGGCVGLALYTKTVDGEAHVWVSAGTVEGDLPTGFDPVDGKSVGSSGVKDVWIKIEIDETDGSITSREVASGSSLPNATDTSFYYLLGRFEYEDGNPTVTNYGCGSIAVAVCRNYFSVEAPFYGVTFYR